MDIRTTLSFRPPGKFITVLINTGVAFKNHNLHGSRLRTFKFTREFS